MTGEDILEAGLKEAHEEVSPNSALDPIMITTIISAIFEGIRLCGSQQSAATQISRGKAIAKTRLRKILKGKGYSRKSRFELADKLAERGRNLSPAEVQAIIDDSADVPQPGPSNVSGFPVWPAVLVALLLPSVANAGGFPVGQALASVVDPFPVTFEQPVEPRATRIVLETQDNCGPCNALIKGPIAELEKVGFSVGEGPENHIQIVDVTGTDHGPTPTLNLIHHGKEFAELVGSDHKATFIADWYNTFIECGKVPDGPKPVKTVSGSNVPSGGSWVYYGSGSLGGHLVRNHGYSWDDVRGKTHGQLVYLHSYAHNNGRPYRVGKAKVNRIARSRAYCPTCPR